MSSIRDIAKETGLSIGTISRYINKSGYVSKESASKIKKAIIDLDYVPNEHARAVFTNQSKLIGIVVSSLSNPFFSEMTITAPSLCNYPPLSEIKLNLRFNIYNMINHKIDGEK